MKKNRIFTQISILSVFLLPSTLFAAHWQNFTGNSGSALPSVLANRPSLSQMQSVQATSLSQIGAASAVDPLTHQRTIRYQQYYYGVPVAGAQITVHQSESAAQHSQGFGTASALSSSTVTGRLLQDIQLNPNSLRTLQDPAALAAALQSTQQEFLAHLPDASAWTIEKSHAKLMITLHNNQVLPVYHLTWRATHANKAPIVYRAYVSTEAPYTVLKQWNAVVRYSDNGLGGNINTGQYEYGKNGLPALNVKQHLRYCTLDDGFVRVVNLFEHYYGEDNSGSTYLTPFRYQCGNPQRDPAPFRGAYGVTSDAYFFGQVVDQMYLSWLGMHPVKDNMTLRVHFAFGPDDLDFDNAFWDPDNRTMNFGDGSDQLFLPLVSLDVTAHEISHGFTTDHSDMEYHDESGSLNEAFSDMASMAAQQYLIDTHPETFAALYNQTEPSWLLGKLIARNHEPLRYLNLPSADGASADCLEQVDNCELTYDNLTQYAEAMSNYTGDPNSQQGFIVHHGSGVFNHAFYYLATMPNWGIKKAFILMAVSNRDGYWSTGGLDQADYFNQSACGTIAAARALNYETQDVINAFHKVGVVTHTSCETVSPPKV